MPGGLTTLELVLASDDYTLSSWAVNESYTLTVRNAHATIRADSPFGGLHGLETFYQLLPSASARTYSSQC